MHFPPPAKELQGLTKEYKCQGGLFLYVPSRDQDCVNGSVGFKQCLGPLPAIIGLSPRHMQSPKWHKALSRASAEQNGATFLSIQNIHLITVLQCVLSVCFHVRVVCAEW